MAVAVGEQAVAEYVMTAARANELELMVRDGQPRRPQLVLTADGEGQVVCPVCGDIFPGPDSPWDAGLSFNIGDNAHYDHWLEYHAEIAERRWMAKVDRCLAEGRRSERTRAVAPRQISNTDERGTTMSDYEKFRELMEMVEQRLEFPVTIHLSNALIGYRSYVRYDPINIEILLSLQENKTAAELENSLMRCLARLEAGVKEHREAVSGKDCEQETDNCS